MMSIGFCGAHRTGKTTLAREYAERFDVQFIETDIAGIIQRKGFNTTDAIPLEDRIDLQFEILDQITLQYQAARKDWVTDRTPLDMLAYTLMELDMGKASGIGALDERINDYIKACFDTFNRHISMAILVQPGIEIIPDPSKAAASTAYIEAINAMIMGLMNDTHNYVDSFALPRHMTDLEFRIQSVSETIEARMEDIYGDESQYPIVFN